MRKRILSLSIVIGIALYIGIYRFNANGEITNLELSAYDTSILRGEMDPGEGLPK